MPPEKLKKLGIELPLLPTTSVGSFPRPEELKKIKSKALKGEVDSKQVEEKEQQATADWIKKQEEIGIDVLVDGEQYRGDMVAYFAEHLRGMEKGGLVRSYGNRYYHKPVITGEVRWEKPITVGWWKFAQGLTAKPVKGMLTGPYTLTDWSFDEYYPSRRDAAMAFAREIRKEVEELIRGGAKIIQIDEPALSARPEELPMAIEAMHVVTDGLPAYFITHVCYGAFEFIYPGLLNVPVDNFDLEMTNSGFDLIGMFRRNPFSKDLSFGVVESHSHRIDPEEAVFSRIKAAVESVPAAQVWCDPDCGLKTRTTEEAIGKLQVLVAAAKRARRELNLTPRKEGGRQ
ncbi:MAG: methionine synthase [Nitrospirae bacterium]|nr:methionine synthase [Nitrospirota bacterium]